jgi:D-alanyl-D-alanine carboxypeptidase
VNSAYRSYEYQGATLRSEIAAYGCARALGEVAAPGHSEHQLGLAADLTSADVGWDLQDTFGQTPEGLWLAAHAMTYGFVLSYPKGKEGVTGYNYEPWHFRFVTPAVAQAITTSGKTATEYLLSMGSLADTGIEKTQALAPAGFGCS